MSLKRWAKSNGVGSSYSGKLRTMFIFGERASKVQAEVAGLVQFKIVVQND